MYKEHLTTLLVLHPKFSFLQKYILFAHFPFPILLSSIFFIICFPSPCFITIINFSSPAQVRAKAASNEPLTRPFIFGHHHYYSFHLPGAGLLQNREYTTDNIIYFPRKIPILVEISSLHLALLGHHIPPFLSVSIVTYITFQKVIIWNQLSLYMNSAFV